MGSRGGVRGGKVVRGEGGGLLLLLHLFLCEVVWWGQLLLYDRRGTQRTHTRSALTPPASLVKHEGHACMHGVG